MLMVLFFALLRCFVGCGDVFPSPPFFMFSWPKSWLGISVPVLVSLAWLYLGLFSTLHVFLPMQTIPLSLFPRLFTSVRRVVTFLFVSGVLMVVLLLWWRIVWWYTLSLVLYLFVVLVLFGFPAILT